jgi:nicotinate-nucleotide adenylyltransferase
MAETTAAFHDFYDPSAKRIAIMGGTFDPIHYGHLVTAEAVRQEFQIDQVLFIPTGRPPHKSTKKVSDPENRYLMTLLATQSNDHFFASRLEIDRTGYTYTIDTIHALKEIYGSDTEIFFITGADAFLQIFNWHNAEELLHSCTFVAATRPGYNKDELLKHVDHIIQNHPLQKFHFIEVPALSISSSDIRERVLEGRSIKYLLPESVESFIHKYHLYKENQ